MCIRYRSVLKVTIKFNNNQRDKKNSDNTDKMCIILYLSCVQADG